MDKKIKIFYGPTTEFKEILEEYDSITLNFFVNSIDTNRLQNWISQHRDKRLDLICYSEEFSSVKEHFLSTLPYLIRELLKEGCLDNCYFQNPPKVLKDGLVREYGLIEDGGTVEIKEFEFGSITEEQFKTMLQEYETRIIGQKESFSEVLTTMYPLTKNEYAKPIVMLFYGPSGVGKTETAKFISETIGNGRLFRKQLSMYQTNESASYLFGGSVNERSFARDLLERESNVIFLDEFDKCYSGFYNAFYQIFDEGIFTDKNYEVKLSKTIFICTSNYGSEDEIIKHLGLPIFSRFDSLIAFNNLEVKDKVALIKKSYQNHLSLWNEREREVLEKKNTLDLLVSKAEYFSDARNISNGIKTYMSKVLLEETFKSQ